MQKALVQIGLHRSCELDNLLESPNERDGETANVDMFMPPFVGVSSTVVLT